MMQLDHDHGDTSPETSSSMLSPGSSSNPIDLKEFPSDMDYSSGLDHERSPFDAENSPELTSPSSGFNSKSSPFNLAGRSRLSNLMFPKVRRRPFQCKYCSFSCPSATNLSIHMRIHTGEKPYKCGTCSYASARKQNLFRHMSTVHKADHVTMSGPSPVTCAYPLGAQSSVEERMPVVENVYGNVQDVVLIDGDPVKIIGREQSSFPTSDAQSSSPHLAQVFPCESASRSSLQDDVVEVLPGSNPTSATEFSTRHYADGSRFIFVGGGAASSASSATNTAAPQLDHFEAPKENTHQHQARGGLLNNDGIHQLKDMASPEEPSSNPTEGLMQTSVYKEPIMGALKRKQGRASTHTTLKNILDSPLMFPNKQGMNTAVSPSQGSVNHLEKSGSSGIKIIQSEEDLEEVLEGRRSGIRMTPSAAGKQQDLTPSPRSLNGASSVESAPFVFARESPDESCFPGTRHKVRTKDVVAPATDSIPSSQTSMYRHKQVHPTRSPLMRKSAEQMMRSLQPSQEDIAIVTQTSKRAPTANCSSGRNANQQNVGGLSQVGLTSRNINSSTWTSMLSNAFDKDGPVDSSPGLGEKKPIKGKHYPSLRYDLNSDQKFVRESQRNDSYKGNSKATLTIQVDLNKVMCAAARKWLRSHLEDCEVCEINLPVEQEESHFSSVRQTNYGVDDGGCGSCGREKVRARENESGRLRHAADHHDQGYLRQRRHGSCHQRSEPHSGSVREDFHFGMGTGDSTRRQHQTAVIDVEDDVYLSDSREDDNQMLIANRRIISPRGSGSSSDKASVDTVKCPEQSQLGRQEERGLYYAEKGRYHGPTHESGVHAKTTVVSSSCLPISSPHIIPGSSQTVAHPTRKRNQPEESAEYIAFLKAELNRRKAGAKRQKCICDICGKVCLSKAQLVSHRRVHIHVETSQLFRCAICRFCTLHYKLLKRHISEKHTSASRKNTYTQCKICNKAVGIAKVTSHMQTVHGLGFQVTGTEDDRKQAEHSGETHRDTAEYPDDGQHHVAEREGPQQEDAVAMDASTSPQAKEDATTDADCTQTVSIKQEPLQED